MTLPVSWETCMQVKKQRIDAFEIRCWRRLFRVPWTARRSNQSILNEINPEYSSEELVLKRQYFGHPKGRADSSEKTLKLGKTEGRRRRGRQRMRRLDRGWDGWTASLMQWTRIWTDWEMVKDREARHAAVHGLTMSGTCLSDSTTILCNMLVLSREVNCSKSPLRAQVSYW